MNYEGKVQFRTPNGMPQQLVWMLQLDDREHKWTIRKTRVKYMRIDVDGITTLVYDGRWKKKPFWFTDKVTWHWYNFLLNLYNCYDI